MLLEDDLSHSSSGRSDRRRLDLLLQVVTILYVFIKRTRSCGPSLSCSNSDWLTTLYLCCSVSRLRKTKFTVPTIDISSQLVGACNWGPSPAQILVHSIQPRNQTKSGPLFWLVTQFGKFANCPTNCNVQPNSHKQSSTTTIYVLYAQF